MSTVDIKRNQAPLVEDQSFMSVRKASLSQRKEPPPPDLKKQDERYKFKYIPTGGMNVVSPLLAMKYCISKNHVRLQDHFERRLTDAILENPLAK